MKRMTPSRWILSICLVAVVGALVISGVPEFYMKTNPPPDSDKPMPVPAGDDSCWMHTAANMLAGAGYGDGTTLQARADDIFSDLSTQYPTLPSGWIDTALSWWLTSANNTWPANP